MTDNTAPGRQTCLPGVPGRKGEKMNASNHTIAWGIAPSALELGVKFRVATVQGVGIRKKSKKLKAFLKSRRGMIKNIDPDSDKRLATYRQMFKSLDISDVVSSPEYLIRIVRKNGCLPGINTLVDAYNQISAEQRVVASAHDLDKISGPVVLEIAEHPVEFKPLSNGGDEFIRPGEWFVHDDQHALCRLNCKQSRLSSTNLDTRDLLVYVQGNAAISNTDLDGALFEICQTITLFNGGVFHIMPQTKV